MDEIEHVHITAFGVTRCDSCGQWHVYREHDGEVELLDKPFSGKDAATAYAHMMSAAFRLALDIHDVPWVEEP